MVAPDPSGGRRGQEATGSAKATNRRSYRFIWLFVALIGIVAGTVCVFQARYQVRIEHGVTGSYQVGSCGYRRSRTQEDAWVCDGRFRLDDRGDGRWARLDSYQPEEPRGRVTVMAAGPDDDVVWLPADVSSARRWTLSAVCYGVAVMSVALYLYFGFRYRRRRGPA